MGQYLEDNGYYHEISTPEAHYQNFVERYVNTIVRATATLLHSHHFLKSKHWDWALFHAIDCRTALRTRYVGRDHHTRYSPDADST